MASDYVTGERMKALYSTLFQPVVQTVYLSQFQEGVTKQKKRILETSVHLTNILLGVALGSLENFGEEDAAVVALLAGLLGQVCHDGEHAHDALHLLGSGEVHANEA